MTDPKCKCRHFEANHIAGECQIAGCECVLFELADGNQAPTESSGVNRGSAAQNNASANCSPVEDVSGCLYCESAWPLDGTVHLTPNGRFPCVKGMPVPQIPDGAGTGPRPRNLTVPGQETVTVDRGYFDAIYRTVAAYENDCAILPEDSSVTSYVTFLQLQRDEARKVVRDTLWMAGRYADGRRSYAVGLYNDALALAQAGGYADGAKPARDGMFDPIGSVSDSAGEKEKK